ncbi:MAG TPA: hypothetical protein VGE56_00765 [Rhodocyclaceae bacterium]
MSDQVEVELYLAWWLQPYFWCLAWFCALTGCHPDEKKLTNMIDRAIRVRVKD